jgi:hypothetical protein
LCADPESDPKYNVDVSETVTRRLPVVAGLAYIERVRRLPSRFTVTLTPEPDNRFNPQAVAVLVGGEKVGYLPPELSSHYAHGPAVECPARHATPSVLENTGVAILLDACACPPPVTK